MKTDTITADQLASIYEHELVCQWCEDEAHWAFRHDETIHFNCNQCKNENATQVAQMLADGDTDGWCMGCQVHMDVRLVEFFPI